ncbi:MAG: ABC transporter permease [Betaproteobacteria bacterium PRO3]|nr:ABC transporter permease [Betaproteobacteria bacterium PRO3]
MSKAARPRLEQLAPWLLSALILVVWQLVCWAFDISDFIFPSPLQVARSLAEYAGPIAGHAWRTFWTTMAGFAIGVAVGVLLGVIVGSSRFIYNALYPLLVAFNSVPKSAFVPILVVWFGIGTVPAVLTAFLICFFPIVVNVATGLATLEPELEDVLRALGATRYDVLTKVGLPRSLPFFFASLKVAITLAFVGTVVSETVAANEGIGYLMMSAGSSMRMPLVFAGLFVIGVMAMAMYELFAILERRMTGWAHRGQAAAP